MNESPQWARKVLIILLGIGVISILTIPGISAIATQSAPEGMGDFEVHGPRAVNVGLLYVAVSLIAIGGLIWWWRWDSDED